MARRRRYRKIRTAGKALRTALRASLIKKNPRCINVTTVAEPRVRVCSTAFDITEPVIVYVDGEIFGPHSFTVEQAMAVPKRGVVALEPRCERRLKDILGALWRHSALLLEGGSISVRRPGGGRFISPLSEPVSPRSEEYTFVGVLRVGTDFAYKLQPQTPWPYAFASDSYHHKFMESKQSLAALFYNRAADPDIEMAVAEGAQIECLFNVFSTKEQWPHPSAPQEHAPEVAHRQLSAIIALNKREAAVAADRKHLPYYAATPPVDRHIEENFVLNFSNFVLAQACACGGSLAM